jgi:sec-independent protein translocase protein TatC
VSALRKPTPEYDDYDYEAEAPLADGAMSFLAHLDELRKRLIISLAAIVIGFAVALVFYERLLSFVLEPLARALPPGGRLIYTEPTEGMAVAIYAGLLAGLMLASPVVLWQVWLFIAPGLYAREKRLAIPFVASASLCFVGGAAFSHYIAFPAASEFFASFSNEFMEFRPRVSASFSFYIRMTLVFGLAFQMPTLAMVLARMRLITARWLIRNFRYAFLAIFIIAAVVTTTGDPLGQLTLAVPMLVLYGISIIVAWICAPRRPA